MTAAYINRIATAVPPFDVHKDFVRLAATMLPDDRRQKSVFGRMAEASDIEHRYSFLTSSQNSDSDQLDDAAFYVRGQFPGTAARMRLFQENAPKLATKAVEDLQLGSQRDGITHLFITSCTGFTAPGLDLELVGRCGLPSSVERTLIGFMGCYAAVNALKLARHVVRSEPKARVLIVNLELCTLHMQDTSDLIELLMFLLWGDGCAATLVTSEPEGIQLDSFRAAVVPDTSELMQWHIGDTGFNMVLSGQVPASIRLGLDSFAPMVLEGAPVDDFDLWAIHPGGRTVLDAVEKALDLAPASLSHSREVLRRFGNMSSATIMFVLQSMLREGPRKARGCGMAFGPGLTTETMLFRTGAHAAPGPLSPVRDHAFAA